MTTPTTLALHECRPLSHRTSQLGGVEADLGSDTWTVHAFTGPELTELLHWNNQQVDCRQVQQIWSLDNTQGLEIAEEEREDKGKWNSWRLCANNSENKTKPMWKSVTGLGDSFVLSIMFSFSTFNTQDVLFAHLHFRCRNSLNAAAGWISPFFSLHQE